MGQNSSSTLEEMRGSYSVEDISADLDKSELSYITNVKFERAKNEYGRFVLDGSYKGLRRIFPLTLKYKNIDVLKLNCNYLRTFPNDMKILKKLKELYLHENNFEFVPLQICSIKSLETLSLRCNQLKSLPDPIGELTSLVHLDVSYNVLLSLPPSFQKLQRLETLNLDGNAFLQIPQVLFQIQTLRILKVSGNKLSTLPHELMNLTKMEELYINENFIEEILSLLKEYLQDLRVFEMVGNKTVRSVKDFQGNEVDRASQ